MGFKSDAQRKGFFSNLRDNIHDANLRRHEATKKKILEKVEREKGRLERQQESFESEAQVKLAQSKLDKVKNAEDAIKKERFEISKTGKFINASKRGVQSAVQFEKEHGKDQVNQLKKIGKKIFK